MDPSEWSSVKSYLAAVWFGLIGFLMLLFLGPLLGIPFALFLWFMALVAAANGWAKGREEAEFERTGRPANLVSLHQAPKPAQPGDFKPRKPR